MNDPVVREVRWQKLKDTLDEINLSMVPSWVARDSIARTLITISSAAVALTLTFSNSITALQVSQSWKLLIFAVWILFILSILAAILSLWASRNARTILPKFLKQAIKLFTLTEKERDEAIEQFANDTVNKLAKFQKRNKWSEYFLKAALIFFATAMLILGTVGGKQLIP